LDYIRTNDRSFNLSKIDSTQIVPNIVCEINKVYLKVVSSSTPFTYLHLWDCSTNHRSLWRL